jgi:hypothetical protein
LSHVFWRIWHLDGCLKMHGFGTPGSLKAQRLQCNQVW